MANLALVFDLIGKDSSASRTFNNVGDAADRAGRKGDSFGSAISNGLKIAGGAFLASGIISGFKGFIDAAAESAKIGALTENVIKSTGGAANLSADQVGNLVTAISNKTGVDDEAIQSGANLLLTFTNIKNAAGDGNDIFTQTTQIMTDMSAALGTDASGSAIQLGKALNDPIKGVSALSKVGVSFTQQQKDQIKTLQESGDTLGAQKIILAELSREFGGAAEAAATPMDKLKVNLGNLQEAIGGALLPAAANFASFATGTLLPAFSNIGGYAKQAFDILFHGDFTGGPLSEDSGIVDTLFNIREGFVRFGDSVRTFVQGDTFAAWVEIAKGAAAGLWAALQTVAGFVTGTLVPAFLTVGAAVFATAEFFRQHQTAAMALGAVIGVVAALVVAAWAMQVASAVAGSAASVVAWFAVATGAQTGAATTTLSTAQVVFGWVASAAAAVANAAIVVGGWVLMGVQSMIQAARMAAAWFIALGPVGWVIATVVALVALIVANWDTVVSWTKTAWSAVTDAVGAAWEWIKGAVSAAAQFVVNIFLNWTLPGLIIKHWDTIKGAFSAGVDAAIGFVTGLPGRAVSALGSLGSMIAGVASSAWSAFSGAVSSGISNVIGLVKGLPGQILSGLGNVGSLLLSAGGDLIRGFINGIKNMAGSVASVALDAAKGAVNSVKDFLGIRSPSVVFTEIGANVGKGLVNGLTNAESAVTASAGSLAISTVRGFSDALGASAADNPFSNFKNLTKAMAPSDTSNPFSNFTDLTPGGSSGWAGKALPYGWNVGDLNQYGDAVPEGYTRDKYGSLVPIGWSGTGQQYVNPKDIVDPNMFTGGSKALTVTVNSPAADEIAAAILQAQRDQEFLNA